MSTFHMQRTHVYMAMCAPADLGYIANRRTNKKGSYTDQKARSPKGIGCMMQYDVLFSAELVVYICLEQYAIIKFAK